MLPALPGNFMKKTPNLTSIYLHSLNLTSIFCLSQTMCALSLFNITDENIILSVRLPYDQKLSTLEMLKREKVIFSTIKSLFFHIYVFISCNTSKKEAIFVITYFVFLMFYNLAILYVNIGDDKSSHQQRV